MSIREIGVRALIGVRDELELRRFARRQDHIAYAARQVRDRHLTYLSVPALLDLADAALDVERQGIPGEFIEAGTALGGSGILLAHSKQPGRSLRLYDTFGLIPPPSHLDGADVHQRYAVIANGQASGIDGGVYYGYREDLLTEVQRSFRDLDAPLSEVSFIKGLYEDTLQVDFQVALAHIDCDWYESVMTCLTRIEPHLSVGGRFVFDDYYEWSGCRRAVDEFFSGREGYQFSRQSRLHVVRTR